MRRSDDRSHRKQGLQDRLTGSRIGEKNDRLPGDKQSAAGEALYHAERDQQVQPICDGGDATSRAHGQRRADDQDARIGARHEPGGGHESDKLRGGVSDVEPGELVGGCVGVADDVVAPERQDGACDCLRQSGEHDACDKNASCRAPVMAWRSVDDRSHVPLPRSISTRADRPGTTRPGNGFLTKRIFTGTR